MNEDQQSQHSHLFTVRLWMEQLGNDQAEWRGKVRHVPSGATRYFRDWSSLVTFLLAKLEEVDSGESSIERE